MVWSGSYWFSDHTLKSKGWENFYSNSDSCLHQDGGLSWDRTCGNGGNVTNLRNIGELELTDSL